MFWSDVQGGHDICWLDVQGGRAICSSDVQGGHGMFWSDVQGAETGPNLATHTRKAIIYNLFVTLPCHQVLSCTVVILIRKC